MSSKEMVDYYVQVSGATRCVDERGDKQGELLGVQLPGGSQHLMDLFALAFDQAGNDFNDDMLFKLTEQVYRSDMAVELRLEPGMHIDDEHGELSVDACTDRVFGCGYDKVRSQVLARIGVNIQYNPGDRIDQARSRGWKIQVLTGDHFTDAAAAINKLEGKTLKTQALLNQDQVPSFNYDHWAVTAILPAMVEVLADAGYSEAAKILQEEAVDWGKRLYLETLDILSNGAITAADVVEVG